MAEAIRELTVERGLDPQDFVLCRVRPEQAACTPQLFADELEIGGRSSFPRCRVPSAWGDAQRRHPTRRSWRASRASRRGATGQLADVVVTVAASRSVSSSSSTVVSAEAIRFDTAADLRYVGQEYSLTLPVRPDEVARSDVSAVAGHRSVASTPRMSSGTGM